MNVACMLSLFSYFRSSSTFPYLCRINITVVIPLTHQSVSSSGKTPHNEYAVFRYSVASIEISTLSKEQDSFGSVGSDSSILRKLINRRRKILEPYESSGTANGASPSTSETDYEYDDSDNDSTNGHNGKKVPQLHNQAVGGIGGLAEEEITFEKNLNIRGMKLSLAKIHGIVFETQMDYEKLIPKSVVFHSKPRSKSAIRANSITYHTILNPTHIFTRVSMYNVRSFDETIFKRERSKVIPTMADATISSVVLDVSVDVNNIEITPSINELRTLRDVSNMTSMLKMRSKFGMLRPSACVQGHARQWWLYAISSIIVVARESRRISASDASDKDIDGTPADEDESGNDIGFSRVVAENKIVLDAFRWSYIKVYKRSIVLKFRELLNSVKMAFPGNSSIPFSKSIKRFSPESSIVLAACKPSIEFLPDDLKLECMDYERILNEHQLATSRAAIRKIFIESAEVSVDLMKLLMCNVVPTEVTIQMLLDNVSNLVDASLDSMEENAEEQPDSDDDYNFPDFSNHPNYQFTPVSIVPDSVPASASIDRESSVFKQVAQPTGTYEVKGRLICYLLSSIVSVHMLLSAM